ncbi:uncharacterized protein LOC126902281 [Daktulosphaira vitifoliae]|uniref:uncharacterized protein LOC126902281 n=1 Tax=Daktulosphaira vitifoliae TaxID=58002 RepID=UPI0021AA9BCC|nr:uncharacterized protein LOC126902281 [Daktulosphaira vitifoliae]
MKYFLLFMLLISIKLSLCHYSKYLLCFHTSYFLHFFKYNERFLLEIENNKDYITIENLMNYGKALQTHSKVVMIFLNDLKNYNLKRFPFTLITVNMYLNNLSDSLNMIVQNDDKKNDAQKLLEGYKIIHLAIKEELTDFINRNCKIIPFNIHNTVSCYFPMKEMKCVATSPLKTNDNLKNEILKKFELIVKSNSYEKFHPKNFLFYDIMTQQILTNKNKIKIDNSKHIELNLLRFTPLNFKCSNGTRLTIQDIFEYMKYDFNSIDVYPYIKMVIYATFRPIAIIIRNFLTLIQVASSEYSESVKFWIKPTLIKMGKKIINYVIDVISLSMYKYRRSHLQNEVLVAFYNALKNYIDKIMLSEIDIKYNNMIIKSLSYNLIKNKIHFTSDIALTNEHITESNVDKIITELEKIMKKVEIYINDLKKWNHSFDFIIKSFKIRYYNISSFRNFIDFNVLNCICNTESHSEICNASKKESNDIDIGYYKDVQDVDEDYNNYWKIITELNLENLKDKGDENDINANDSFAYQSKYKPLYMIDYWPYNL